MDQFTKVNDHQGIGLEKDFLCFQTMTIMMVNFRKDFDRELESTILKMITHLMMVIGRWTRSMVLENIDFPTDRLFQAPGRKVG